MTDDAAWLNQAIELAVRNVADGGGPFGALVVRDGDVVATGQNRVTRDLDPSAHAEVQAIRNACRATGDFSLAGMTLYASCEPCPMCVSASLWARLDRVVYAADRDDAARGGFDDREFYELFARERSTWPTLVEEMRLQAARAPFDAWLAKANRTAY
jgi:guanine deaminase